MDADLCLFCEEAEGQPTLQIKVSGCAANETVLSDEYYETDFYFTYCVAE